MRAELEQFLAQVRESLDLPAKRADRLVEELRSHLLADYEERVKAGKSEERAAREAIEEVGGAATLARAWRIEYAHTGRTWSRVVRVFFPLMVIGLFWEVAWSLAQPGGVTRIGTWFMLAVAVSWLVFLLDEFFDVFSRQKRAVSIRVGDDCAVVTDQKGQTTEFPWHALRDVVVVPPGKRSQARLILHDGKQALSIPQTVSDSEGLAAEIVNRTGFVRVLTPLRNSEYRRYGRPEAEGTPCDSTAAEELS